MRNTGIALSLLLVLCGSLHADFPAQAPDPQKLANLIDRHITARLQELGVPPAPRSDDAEFMRRVYLDITGRIPAAHDVREFLASADPNKRARLIDELLASPRFASHFAALWRSFLLSEASASPEARIFRSGFEAWLRQKFRTNVGFDRLVTELLTAPISQDPKDPQAVMNQPEQANPLAFFAVKEAKPENLAASTTRVFLGIQIECAQCHNHPFARWSRNQFWSQAAFFAGIERHGDDVFAPISESIGRHEAVPAPGKAAVGAALLDDQPLDWKPGQSPRAVLAAWLTSDSNPYFARATVNRVWGQLFGVGIVDPVDDFHDGNPPSHPALLDELASQFVAARYDLAFLIRGICLSQTYQRSSIRTHPTQADGRTFARMPVRGMTAEQFFDSLILATGYRERENQRGSFGLGRNSPRERFLSQFAPQGKSGEPDTSIPQALELMNGRFTSDATRLQTSPALTAIGETPGMTVPNKIEALFLVALSRPPSAVEFDRYRQFVEHADQSKQTERLADVFWILLNSSEFRFIH